MNVTLTPKTAEREESPMHMLPSELAFIRQFATYASNDKLLALFAALHKSETWFEFWSEAAEISQTAEALMMDTELWASGSALSNSLTRLAVVKFCDRFLAYYRKETVGEVLSYLGV